MCMMGLSRLTPAAFTTTKQAQCALFLLKVIHGPHASAFLVWQGGGAWNYGGNSFFNNCSFNGNKAGANNADDIIVEAGTVTIHNTCPSPYESTTSYEGTALGITGTIGGTAKSFSCVVCPTGLVGTVPNCATEAPSSAPTAAPVDLDNGSLRTTTNFVVGVISALTLAGFFIEGF